MNEIDVRQAIEELREKGDLTMERIANYIEANLDDFMQCFDMHCPECNKIGWEADNLGMMMCENDHTWYSGD